MTETDDLQFPGDQEPFAFNEIGEKEIVIFVDAVRDFLPPPIKIKYIDRTDDADYGLDVVDVEIDAAKAQFDLGDRQVYVEERNVIEGYPTHETSLEVVTFEDIDSNKYIAKHTQYRVDFEKGPQFEEDTTVFQRRSGSSMYRMVPHRLLGLMKASRQKPELTKRFLHEIGEVQKLNHELGLNVFSQARLSEAMTVLAELRGRIPIEVNNFPEYEERT